MGATRKRKRKRGRRVRIFAERKIRLVSRDVASRAETAELPVGQKPSALHAPRLFGDVRAGRAVFPLRKTGLRRPAGPGRLGDGARENRASSARRYEFRHRVFTRGVPLRAVRVAEPQRRFRGPKKDKTKGPVRRRTSRRARGRETRRGRALARGGLARGRAGGGVRLSPRARLERRRGSPRAKRKTRRTRSRDDESESRVRKNPRKGERRRRRDDDGGVGGDGGRKRTAGSSDGCETRARAPREGAAGGGARGDGGEAEGVRRRVRGGERRRRRDTKRRENKRRG